jgi:hypothetical protein
VYYNGQYLRRITGQPIQNWTVLTPNPINVPIWTEFQAYEVGNLVYDGALMFKCLIPNINTQPTANIPSGTWILQAQHPYDATPYANPGGNLYNAGDIATYSGELWVANQTTYLTPAEPTWTSIGRVVWENYNWDGSDYGAGGVVYFNGKYYEQNATTFNSIPPVPSWSSSTFYPANAIIQNAGYVFRCLTPNQTNEPVLWSSSIIYEVGQIVFVNGQSYLCNVKNLNANPSVAIPNWSPEGVYLKWNVAFLPGVGTYRATNDVGPSVLSPNNDLGNWEAVGSDVWEAVDIYWAYVGESNWGGITLGADVSGLYGLSRQYDFVEQYQNTELVNFPTGIGGQPFNVAPERLLNSILGFTWNGIFNPFLLNNLPTNEVSINISGGAVSLYNRMRPVPTYDVVEQVNNELFRVAAATTTRTYTAEGYANLVYSSIVNIYTNIVGGSTLDTVRNTNLVATTSMNCGNLGIAFHGNYIDTPLQRVAGDINELTIELRDEVGEPFYLTNNAIMTATFKWLARTSGAISLLGST